MQRYCDRGAEAGGYGASQIPSLFEMFSRCIDIMARNER